MLETGGPIESLVVEEEEETADARVVRLREALLDAQHELATSRRFAVVIVVVGLEGSGRSDTVNVLGEWMDSRHLHVHALGELSSEERERPPMWQIWRRLPPKGEIGVFYRAWHNRELFEDESMTEAERLEKVAAIVRFERMLAAEGTLVLNFYFHLSRKKQKKRLQALEKDPRRAWRVTKAQWRALALYDESREIRERSLAMLSTADTPWIPLEGSAPRECAVVVGERLRDALTQRFAAGDAPPPGVPPRALPAPRRRALSKLDLSLRLDPREYTRRLAEAQERLALLVQRKRFRKRSLVAVFEGADAAGKGGAIRRITRALDARQYAVIPIAAPTDEERAQPYLWRFWRNLPGRGRIAIFDRSWYGRVLVERVEKFARESDWLRAYDEIADFEAQLVEHGAVVVKFWLQISPEEQLARFQERERTGFKRYKITPEDWRNRDKWNDYQAAVDDVLSRTHDERAPWVLVEANDKHHARVKVIETLADRLEASL